MEYLKVYKNLVQKAYKRKKIYGYYEKHHVYPVSIFGPNDKIVKFTAREHLIAHHLLMKHYTGKYGHDNDKSGKMSKAFFMMTWDHFTGNRYNNLRVCAIARKNMGLCNRGENNPAKRPEVRLKISEAKMGKKRPDLKGKYYFGASEETIKKARKGMIEKKTGVKIDYPEDRKSYPCSTEKAHKIKESRLKTKEKYINMTQDEFIQWMKDISENGKIFTNNKNFNGNISRAIKFRSEEYKIDEYKELILDYIKNLTYSYIQEKYQIPKKVSGRYRLIQEQIIMMGAIQPKKRTADEKYRDMDKNGFIEWLSESYKRGKMFNMHGGFNSMIGRALKARGESHIKEEYINLFKGV